MDIGGIIWLVIFVALIASLYFEMGKAPEFPGVCRRHGISMQWVGYYQDKSVCPICVREDMELKSIHPPYIMKREKFDDECS